MTNEEKCDLIEQKICRRENDNRSEAERHPENFASVKFRYSGGLGDDLRTINNDDDIYLFSVDVQEKTIEADYRWVHWSEQDSGGEDSGELTDIEKCEYMFDVIYDDRVKYQQNARLCPDEQALEMRLRGGAAIEMQVVQNNSNMRLDSVADSEQEDCLETVYKYVE